MLWVFAGGLYDADKRAVQLPHREKANVSFSQNGEENAILRAVANDTKHCTFIDVGAFDGVKYSNTRALAIAGWEGLLVEASPRNFCALRETYKDSPKMTLVNCALGPCTRLIPFIDTGDEFARAAQKCAQATAWVAQITWEHLLTQFGGPWTVVSIDVEGTSADLFLSMPLKEMAPKAVCVEHDGRAVELASYASKYGYKTGELNQENIVLWK
jgi:FkbM family methyltransferase